MNHTLATLTGSPRQVAWANKIREETLAKIRDACHLTKPGQTNQILKYLSNQEKASWWINNRVHFATIDRGQMEFFAICSKERR